MKQLIEYINESFTASGWDKITNRDEVTLEIIQDAMGFGSFMDDRAWAVVDDASYEKIGKNKWQKHSDSAHTLSGSITDKEFFEIIKNAKSDDFKLNLPKK